MPYICYLCESIVIKPKCGVVMLQRYKNGCVTKSIILCKTCGMDLCKSIDELKNGKK